MDTPQPLWPQEAHPWRDESRIYRQRAAEGAWAQFNEAGWRQEAISRASLIIEEAINVQTDERTVVAEPIIEALRAVDLIPAAAATSTNPAIGLVDPLFDTLMGVAAASLLHERTERLIWRAALEMLSRSHSMFMPFHMTIESFYRDDESFRTLFDKLADQILEDEIVDPVSRICEREQGIFLRLLEDWRTAPELQSVWFGLPQAQHIFHWGEFSTLANIYISCSPARLTQLLERFDNPYQIWSAITGLHVNKHFAQWSQLFAYALPAFESNGNWNGKTLEPLLLVIAQDGLRQARLPQTATEETIAVRANELDTLTTAIADVIAAKPQGAQLGLRWGAWLFRMSTGGTATEQAPRLEDLRYGAAPFWRMLEALARSSAATGWNEIDVPDPYSEEVLCVLATKVLAASEQSLAFPDDAPLFRCLPEMPEDFLGENGRVTRDRVRLFWTYNSRPDALKFRIFGLLLVQDDPVSRFRGLWKRTLILRELAEHWQSGQQDDGREDAKQVLGMVLAIGLSVIDYYADSRRTFPRDPQQFGELFRLVYDGVRELRAIELFNREFYSSLSTHLLIRRALYEGSTIRDIPLPVSLAPDTDPTLSTMLADIAGIAPIFFDGLDSLLRNGVSIQHVAAAIRSRGIDLSSLVSAATELNNIDERRPYRIDAASRIVAELEKPESTM